MVIVAVLAWLIDLNQPVQQESITIEGVSTILTLNTLVRKKCFIDWWQLCGFLRTLRFVPPMKMTVTIQLKNC